MHSRLKGISKIDGIICPKVAYSKKKAHKNNGITFNKNKIGNSCVFFKYYLYMIFKLFVYIFTIIICVKFVQNYCIISIKYTFL